MTAIKYDRYRSKVSTDIILHDLVNMAEVIIQSRINRNDRQKSLKFLDKNSIDNDVDWTRLLWSDCSRICSSSLHFYIGHFFRFFLK